MPDHPVALRLLRAFVAALPPLQPTVSAGLARLKQPMLKKSWVMPLILFSMGVLARWVWNQLLLI